MCVLHFCSSRLHRRGFYTLAVMVADAPFSNVSTSFGNRSALLRNCTDIVYLQAAQVCFAASV